MKIGNSVQLFTNSLKFASFKHRSQRRKNGDIPYINHPIQVASILSDAGVTNYQVLSAAILHDTVQDTQTTPQELEQHFGSAVKNLVLECTDDKSLGKVDRKRKQIQKSTKVSSQAKLIKIADKLSNCLDLEKLPPPGWTNERVFGYYLWAWAVCRNLKGVNQILDQKMDQFFKKVGVCSLDKGEEEKKLEAYYEILSNSKGEK